MDDHSIVMAKPAPHFRLVAKVDGGPDPLLLNTERRNLEKARRVDARDLPSDRRATPTIDGDQRPLGDLHRISREEIGNDLEIEGVADVHQRRTGKHNRFAVLRDLQYAPVDWCPDLDAAIRILEGLVVAGVNQPGRDVCTLAAADLELRLAAR